MVDSVAQPAAEIDLDYSVYHQAKTSVVLSGRATYLLGASTDSYKLDSGTDFEAFITIHHESANKFFDISLRANERTQNSSILNQSEMQIGAQIRFGIPIFED